MFDVVTVGSAAVDVFVRIEKHQEEVVPHEQHRDVCYHIGGKSLVTDLMVETGGGGTNSAVAFSRLGLRTGWVGVLGSDEHGRIVEEQLHRERVTLLGKKKNSMTGYSVIITGLEKDHVVLTYKGVNDELGAKDVPFTQLKTRWFYFSSMMGQSLETLKRIARFAREKGVPYAFNPSMYLVGTGPERIRSILDGCRVLILNKEEAQALLGTVHEEDYLLKGLRGLTGGIVVVTDGAHGAYAYDGTAKYVLLPKKTKVAETTGAGDAFGAGFIAGLMMGKRIQDALQLGQAEASSVLGHVGAKEKLLTMREIRAWVKKRPSKVAKERL